MLFSDRENFSKPKDYLECLPPTIGSKDVTESKRKEHELSFHLHFNYERFTSLLGCFAYLFLISSAVASSESGFKEFSKQFGPFPGEFFTIFM